MELDFETVKQLVDYDPATGSLTWRVRDRQWFEGNTRDADWLARSWNKRFAGAPALNAINSAGYRTGAIFRKAIQSHRVIWLVQTGEWPKEDIDHINGDRTDNRWDNLRAVSRSGNARNRKRRTDNRSGHTGVSWRKASKTWVVQVTQGKIRKRVGEYKTLAEAVEARDKAAAGHGYSERHHS